MPGHDGDDHVYVVRRGRVRHEQPAPRTPVERDALARHAAEVFEPAERESSSVPAHEVDELLLLSSWFRRFPDELARTVAPAAQAAFASPAFASSAAAPLLATA